MKFTSHLADAPVILTAVRLSTSVRPARPKAGLVARSAQVGSTCATAGAMEKPTEMANSKPRGLTASPPSFEMPRAGIDSKVSCRTVVEPASAADRLADDGHVD